MTVIKKEAAKKFRNGENCVAYEYAFEDSDINTAVIEVTGRYPEKGNTVNLVSKELVYVEKGSGKLFVNNEEIELEAGMQILIDPNEKFHWDGNLTLIVSCTPAWNPDQYKEVK